MPFRNIQNITQLPYRDKYDYTSIITYKYMYRENVSAVPTYNMKYFTNSTQSTNLSFHKRREKT
jgi:hypothetical protein